MSTVYEEQKDEDGFLYIQYSGESTFGFLEEVDNGEKDEWKVQFSIARKATTICEIVVKKEGITL